MDFYVINLERREDRLKRFQIGSKLADVDCEVIKAVDGKELITKDYWITRYDNLDKIRYLKKGEIGSYLSHYKCFEQSTKDTAMIFEDDARIPIDFWYQFNLKLKHLPLDYDIVLLGTTRLWQRKYKPRCKLVWENEYFAEYEGDIYGLQGYLITKKAMKHLIDCKYPISSPNDIKFCNVGLKVYVVKSDLISLNRLGSDSQG